MNRPANKQDQNCNYFPHIHAPKDYVILDENHPLTSTPEQEDSAFIVLACLVGCFLIIIIRLMLTN